MGLLDQISDRTFHNTIAAADLLMGLIAKGFIDTHDAAQQVGIPGANANGCNAHVVESLYSQVLMLNSIAHIQFRCHGTGTLVVIVHTAILASHNGQRLNKAGKQL